MLGQEVITAQQGEVVATAIAPCGAFADGERKAHETRGRILTRFFNEVRAYGKVFPSEMLRKDHVDEELTRISVS
jgi:hypothetical protein